MKIFPIVAGILEIILACTCMFMSSIPIEAHIAGTPQPAINIAIYGIVAFLLGLIGGIFSIKRTHIVLALIGGFSVVCWSISFTWFVFSAFGNLSSQIIMEAILIGNLMIIFSILSLAFLLTSRTEFSKKVNATS